MADLARRGGEAAASGAGSFLAPILGPVIIVGGFALLVWWYVNREGIPEAIADTFENLKESVEQSGADARGKVDEINDKANEIIDKIQQPIIDIPVIGPALEPYINLPQETVQSVRDWLIGAGLQSASIEPDMELELSRTFIFKDALGNLVDKAGTIIVPFTAQDPDPWHVLQIFRDRVENARRASIAFTRAAQEIKGRQRISDFIKNIPLFDPQGTFESGFQSALDLGKSKGFLTDFFNLSRTAFEQSQVPSPTATLTTITELMRQFRLQIEIQGKTPTGAFNAVLHAFQFKINEPLREQFRISVGGLL